MGIAHRKGRRGRAKGFLLIADMRLLNGYFGRFTFYFGRFTFYFWLNTKKVVPLHTKNRDEEENRYHS